MYPRRTKYGNTKMFYDGVVFDSMRECNRYKELKLLEKAKKISHLSLQPKFTLQEKFIDNTGKKQLPIVYIGDFAYIENGDQIIEDVKPSTTFKTEVYRIKRKLFLFAFPHITHRETY